jgi:arylsulfatase A-like enzyme
MMTLRPFAVLASLAALLSAAPAGHAAPDPPAKPNVLLIYADDLGYGDVSCYNRERGHIATPGIDRLAAEGMRFTDAHSSSGVCSPSRYTLLTGRYHWRTRLQNGIVPLWGQPLIAPRRLTLASLAKQQGYRTACFGKWHLGWNWPIPPDQSALFKDQPKGKATATDAHRRVWQQVFSQPIPDGPTSRGFDLYFGTDVPNWPPFCFLENNRTTTIPSEFLPAQSLGNHMASNQGPATPNWSLEAILPTLTDRTIRFLSESASQPQPFFLYLALTSPHTPLAVNTPWKNKSGLLPYADFVMETDAAIGRILDALDASGAASRTLVVFSSDNGCAPYIGKPELEAKGHFPSGPLRGAKSDAWEGGHRVPFIVRWPGTVAPGSTCPHLVHQADLLRTFADVLGTTLPDDAGEDSISFLASLKGQSQPVRSHAISTASSGVPALRLGPWKYIASQGSGGWSKGTDPSQPVQLYNLDSDLAESTNLAASQPAKVAEMQALLEKLIRDGRSTDGKPQANDVQVTRFPAPAGNHGHRPHRSRNFRRADPAASPAAR